MHSSTYPFEQVPPLPIVVPLAAVTFALMMWYLHRRFALTVLRAAVAAVACTYGVGIIINTIFPIYLNKPRNTVSWWEYGNFTPLVGTDLHDMIQNVVVFLPLGFLIPLLIGARSVRRVVLYGFLVSFIMETVQFVNALTGGGGHAVDVNDLLANTFGALVGYGLFRLLLLVPPLSRLAAAASWPRKSTVEMATDSDASSGNGFSVSRQDRTTSIP
jgi:hypothetical protein